MRLLIFVLIFVSAQQYASAQTYLLKTDSVNFITLKVGKTYQYQIGADMIKDEFKGFNGDTLLFKNGKHSYKDITAFRNPKRKPFYDALAYPLSIGSCIAVSTIPISYVKGYFLADTDRMFQTLILFIGETIVFASTRNYLSNNKKWIKISDLDGLDYKEKD